MVPKKKLYLPIESYIFSFFSIYIFAHDMMSSSMQPLQFEYEVRDSFQEILQVPQFWSFESRPTSIKQIPTHLHLQT